MAMYPVVRKATEGWAVARCIVRCSKRERGIAIFTVACLSEILRRPQRPILATRQSHSQSFCRNRIPAFIYRGWTKTTQLVPYRPPPPKRNDRLANPPYFLIGYLQIDSPLAKSPCFQRDRNINQTSHNN